jgi:hypothetical protein
MDIIGLLTDFEQKQHMKYKEPIKGKSIRKLFRENGYKVYLVDEFRTSCMCSKCKINTAKCEKFMIRENPKPYKKGNILVHGLLKCKICGSVWNRDVNASINIYRIAKNAINKIERPLYLCREKMNENKEEKPTKKKKIKNNNSVEVDASTKS